MTTYSKETALYDTGAINTGITNAGKTASNFLSVDNSGVMVYDGSSGTQTPSAPSATTNNVFIDSDSVDVRKGTTVLATFGTEAEIRTTDGTVLAHIGYATGQAQSGTSTNPYYTFGRRISDTASTRGNWSVAEGIDITASGYCSHAEGLETVTEGNYSHAEGNLTQTTESGAHAEGSFTLASGLSSHAEGAGLVSSNQKGIIASGSGSHAEGMAQYGSATATIIASGAGAHAEGCTYGTYSILASGLGAHAEGRGTSAIGDQSHAGGLGTIAQKRSQTAIGEWNKIDNYEGHAGRGEYVFIIGNGSSNDDNYRSNALTVDWNGGIQMFLDSTDDADLTQAISDLGWTSDVIV